MDKKYNVQTNAVVLTETEVRPTPYSDSGHPPGLSSKITLPSKAAQPLRRNTSTPQLQQGGTRWRSWLGHCATSLKVAGSIPDFSLTFRPHCGPGVDSASNRNEYQEYFLGGKGGRCVVLTTCHLHVPIVLKSGSLNLLEPSGPVQACNGTALPYSYSNRDLISVVKETTIRRLTVCVGANGSGCVQGSVVSRGVWRAETGRGLASRCIQSATPQQGAHTLRARHGRCHYHCICNTGRRRLTFLLQPVTQIYCLPAAFPFMLIHIKHHSSVSFL